MLRGLAIGLSGLALLAMLVARVMLPANQQPSGMLEIAFGAAALFAIAATVTLFAVEREEGTALLLQILPQRPGALLVGKLAAAIAVTLLVLGALSLLGFACAGAKWPSQAQTANIASQGSVAIAEAFVWGLLASLLCRNPLLAAVMGIAAASLNSQLAMALTVNEFHGFTLRDYQAAVPGRLALLALGAAADVWLGLRWLRIATPRQSVRTRAKAVEDNVATPKKRAWTSLFARLVWQTVRQSWQTIFAGALAGIFMTCAFAVILASLFTSSESRLVVIPLGFLFTPALLGALVFRADQRRRQYRFLAEHAGRPRTLWLARQLVWLIPLLAIAAVLIIIVNNYFGSQYLDTLVQQVRRQRNSINASTVLSMGIEAESSISLLIAATLAAWCSLLTAYAFGQFFSLTLRSEVLAGLAALLTSIVICAWGMVVFAWRLPPLWFIAPLGAGAMLASWLRAPDWMFERAGLTRWLAPLAALLVPIACVLAATPGARLAQVADPQFGEKPFATLADLDTYSDRAREQQTRGQEVADAYTRLASEIRTDSKEKRPADEILEEFVELSRVDCRLPVDDLRYFAQDGALNSLIEFALPGQQFPWNKWSRIGITKQDRVKLREAFDASPALDRWLEALLACRRMEVQRGRSLLVAARVWSLSRSMTEPIGKSLVEWAGAEGQTRERLLTAVAMLKAVDDSQPRPTDLLMNDYLQAQRVVRGELPPEFLRLKKPSDKAPLRLVDWLPYLANELPWERRRSETALQILGTRALNNLLAMGHMEAAVAGFPNRVELWRELLSSPPYEASMPLPMVAVRSFNWELTRRQAQQAALAKTSYLAAAEFPADWVVMYAAAAGVDETAVRRTERVRLALMAYRLENGAYPKSLDALSPDYLPASQYHDPYSSGAFGYTPAGFDLPTWDLGKLIPAQTPLLWCVGPDGDEPREEDVALEYDAKNDSLREVGLDTEPEGDGKTIKIKRVIEFGYGSRYWYRDGFRLPLPEE